MFQKLEEGAGNIVGYKLGGTVTDEEVEAFASEFERVRAVEGRLRVVLLMDYPQDFELKAAWDNLLFWTQHFKDVDRLALVGQKEWEKWIELVERPFIHVQIRYFKSAHVQQAWSWIRSSSE